MNCRKDLGWNHKLKGTVNKKIWKWSWEDYWKKLEKVSGTKSLASSFTFLSKCTLFPSKFLLCFFSNPLRFDYNSFQEYNPLSSKFLLRFFTVPSHVFSIISTFLSKFITTFFKDPLQCCQIFFPFTSTFSFYSAISFFTSQYYDSS